MLKGLTLTETEGVQTKYNHSSNDEQKDKQRKRCKRNANSASLFPSIAVENVREAGRYHPREKKNKSDCI